MFVGLPCIGRHAAQFPGSAAPADSFSVRLRDRRPRVRSAGAAETWYVGRTWRNAAEAYGFQHSAAGRDRVLSSVQPPRVQRPTMCGDRAYFETPARACSTTPPPVAEHAEALEGLRRVALHGASREA